MALSYMAVLTVMTLLVSPFLKKENGVIGVYKQRKLAISTEAIFAFGAYAIYIVFAVSKSVEFGVGANDAYAYYLNFTNADCSLKTFLTDVSTFEPGFSFVVWMIRQFTVNYKWVLCFWHTLTFVLTMEFYKKVYLKNNYSVVVFMGLTLLMTQ